MQNEIVNEKGFRYYQKLLKPNLQQLRTFILQSEPLKLEAFLCGIFFDALVCMVNFIQQYIQQQVSPYLPPEKRLSKADLINHLYLAHKTKLVNLLMRIGFNWIKKDSSGEVTFGQMDRIPVSFHYNGKDYSGHFSAVSGAGTTGLFHLMIDDYYRGQLFYTDNYGWQFKSNDKMFEDLSDYFADVITTWHE